MSKKYYLVKTTQEFYDGHGTPDTGAETISLEHTDRLKGLDLSKCYNEALKPYTEEDDDPENYPCSEDGYNYQENFIQYKEIDSYQYNIYKEILNQYNSLINQF